MNNSPLLHPPKLALSRFYLNLKLPIATHAINLSLCGTCVCAHMHTHAWL